MNTASEQNPETNWAAYNYTYDSDGTCGTSRGDLVKRTDPMGNVTCYHYDALHRVTSATYPSGPYAGVTPPKTFVYDNATVAGNAMQNAKGRLAEAYTGSTGAKLTDLGYSYSARGEAVNFFESMPQSGGYYHLTASYWPSGMLDTLQFVNGGLPQWTYHPDGEGRVSSVTASSGQNPLTGATYNYAGQPTSLTYGSVDADSFSPDPNTDRMSGYSFAVNGTAVNGNLGWNANGSLLSLHINDPFNASNTGTCWTAYDDLERLGQVDCGAGNWGQVFRYDAFGNIDKSNGAGQTGVNFLPTYAIANPTNQYSALPPGTPVYDGNGNLTNDTYYTYAWDADGHMIQVDSTGLTYDALGRRVEVTGSGLAYDFLYNMDGSKLAVFQCCSLNYLKLSLPLPGGASAVYNWSGLQYYRHPDWLGTTRLATSPKFGLRYGC